MGKWNTHGMNADREEVLAAAVDVLGLLPDEALALAKLGYDEAAIWAEVAKSRSGQLKRKSNLIAGYFRRRALRWKELAAEIEADLTEPVEIPARL